jgi:hypothetical protein
MLDFAGESSITPLLNQHVHYTAADVFADSVRITAAERNVLYGRCVQ